MTVEEYLKGVQRIYYQLYVIVEGKQLLADGEGLRLTDIRDSKHRLSKVRFMGLTIPALTEIDELGVGFAAINYGDVHLTIWPKGA